MCHNSTFSWSLSNTGERVLREFGVAVVGFTEFRDENHQGFFPGFRYMFNFVVLNHDVLHAYLDVVPCFLNDDWAEGVSLCCLEWVKPVKSL